MNPGFGLVAQPDSKRNESWRGWAGQGIADRDLRQPLLQTWLIGDIEHVGSTSIPGLAAKPIIDLRAPVDDLGVANVMAPVIAPHHRHNVPPELDQRPYRRFFVKVLDDHRVAHLHLMTTGSSRWHQQLAFGTRCAPTPWSTPTPNSRERREVDTGLSPGPPATVRRGC